MRYAIAARQHGSAVNLPPVRVVIHGTVSPCRVGQAKATGDYFARVTRPASAHKVVDPADVCVCLPDNVVGYHAPPNTHSLGLELCDPQVGDPRRWLDAEHRAMLDLAAHEVAAWCVKYGIPVRRLSVAEVRAGVRGICDHNDVRLAFGMTTHVDVGAGFPWSTFLAAVARYAGQLGGAVKPPSTPRRVLARFTGRLVVDGDLGPKTRARLATVLGIDSRSSWANIVRALQRRLGVHADGIAGPITTRALQRRLGVRSDGVWGPITTRALQRRLNAGRL